METVEVKAPKLKTLGQRMRARREELKPLSRAQLALAVGVSETCIGQWERGETTPESANIFKLADALNVSPKWLLWGKGQITAYPSFGAYRKALEWRDEAETSDEKSAWEEIGAILARVASVCAIALLLAMGFPQKSEAADGAKSVYYVKFRRALFALIRALCHALSGIPRQTAPASG